MPWRSTGPFFPVREGYTPAAVGKGGLLGARGRQQGGRRSPRKSWTCPAFSFPDNGLAKTWETAGHALEAGRQDKRASVGMA